MGTAAVAPDLSGTYDLTLGPSPSPTDYTPDYTPVVPPADQMAPAMAAAVGVPFVPMPNSNSADPSGVNSLNNNPAVNPTPIGSWQVTAQNFLSAATKAFSTFVSGSPTAGIPAARTAMGQRVGGPFVTATGQTNWAVIGLVVVGAGVVIWLAVK